MQSHFTADFFRHNRQKLLEKLPKNVVIVLAGNGLLQKGGDSTYPFHQDSNFWYLTGVDEPDVTLIIDNAKSYLLLPKRNAVREAFDGAISYADLRERSGVDAVLDVQTGWKQLVGTIGKKQVATILPPGTYDAHHGTYANPAARRMMEKLKRTAPRTKVHDIASELTAMRMIKQAPELAALQSAIDITAQTIRDIRQNSATFTHEYRLEAAISQGFRTRGARGHAFEPIVANGGHATVLHNVANNGIIDQHELTVVDIGAEVEHYAADVTRTFAVTKPSTRQQDVHAAVLEVQAQAFLQLKPGVLLIDHERAVARAIGEQLQKLKLIKNIDSASVRKYFPHATSHFLGLDVHDVGDYYRPLEPGMVLTVEPGIYIAEEQIGVRIEDDVRITETGIEIMSESCPRDLF